MKKWIIGLLSVLLLGCQAHQPATKSKVSSVTAYNVKYSSKTVHGHFYKAKGKAKGTVILSHGFGGSEEYTKDYAKKFVNAHYNAYTFNFIHGGADGNVKGMSVLTEARDLQAVYEQIIKRKDVDAKKIFLFGESQGGFVSSYVAAQLKSKIKGLILFYPAFVIQDDARERGNDNNIMGMEVSPMYSRDALSFDIYKVIGQYTSKVLIVHGTADSIVPIRYSVRAQKTYKKATLKKIKGADHGFYGSDFNKASKYAINYLNERVKR